MGTPTVRPSERMIRLIKVKPSLEHLVPYKTLEREAKVKLDANEGKNYLFKEGVVLPELPLHLYPDTHSKGLKEALARVHQINQDQIILGQGSSEVIEHVIKTYVAPGDVILTMGPTFTMYKVYADLHGAKYVELPLLEDYRFDVDALKAAMTSLKPKLTIVCSPNNPTGTTLDKTTLLSIVKATESLVLIDEAYIEFARHQPSLIYEVARHPNLVVARTFSKAYGLAALRIGFGVAHKDLIDQLNLTKIPYNINTINQTLGVIALSRQARVKKYVSDVIRRREMLKEDLLSLGFNVYPSEGNFLFVKSPIENLGYTLADEGILIRIFTQLKDVYRITVGTDKENAMLIETIKEVLARDY